MKLVILTVLAFVATTSGQLGNLGAVGSKLGGRVGAEVGLVTGTVLDTVPSVLGVARASERVPPQPVPGVRAPVPRGPGRGSSSLGGRSYERRGSGGDYAKGKDYVRERTVHEREEGRDYDRGRDWQGRERERLGERHAYY